MGWETIPPQLAGASPLRTSHIRDPIGPQLHFASESFMDECALAAGADPVEFRLRHLKDARHIAVVKAAAERSDWKAGPPGSRGNLKTGRGFAYTLSGETVVAVVADVDVTGRVWPRGFVVAHECGLIVNPHGLTLCIEAGIVQGIDTYERGRMRVHPGQPGHPPEVWAARERGYAKLRRMK